MGETMGESWDYVFPLDIRAQIIIRYFNRVQWSFCLFNFYPDKHVI